MKFEYLICENEKQKKEDNYSDDEYSVIAPQQSPKNNNISGDDLSLEKEINRNSVDTLESFRQQLDKDAKTFEGYLSLKVNEGRIYKDEALKGGLPISQNIPDFNTNYEILFTVDYATMNFKGLSKGVVVESAE